ncbi:MAG: calcium-translocating P-type ATPase, PMCA-type [Clostridium sp.]|nr:calcium-translocating P-type ATPase, PMCA-type [Prevotella sp.]MCM1429699.1 calcium-translocating P-type ATPase, PMCA-type [Clostridium sp.]MCM1474625.1 calcium-translocating P-type ATPase, PMCA-type [Muribaculaceae bacterium]
MKSNIDRNTETPGGRKYLGLTDAEANRSRKEHGINVLTPPAKEPLLKVFLKKFNDPLIIILMIAGVLSIGISCYEYWGLGQGGSVFFEPTGIFIAILLATGLSFIFEHKADKEFAILNQVNDDEPVMAMRNGNARQIPKKEVVVGDVIILNTGNEVPADGELLEAVTLNIDESTLTGEPICHKTTNPDEFDKDATFPSNAAMRGTKVMEGHGVMQVTAVGDNTENGKVYEAAQIDDGIKTPLDEQFDSFGKLVAKLSYVIAAAIVAGRIIMYFVNVPDFEWVSFLTYFLQSLMIAVTLVVVSVPEGLPMAVTLSLAYSMRRMLRTNNLVRKMHACETMGATTVICTDKTGTLTQNRMQVYKTAFYGEPSDEVLYEGIAVNSTAQLDLSGEKPQVLGNPTEGALLLWLKESGADYQRLRTAAKHVEELPFSTERKYMATVVESSTGKRILYVKGAPEIVFGMCADTSGVTREEIDAQLLEYQNQAMRTLGFAYQEPEDGDRTIEEGKVVAERLTFLGIAAISDPVREDVPGAVREVLDAGIKIKIVTGDTPGTAKEIGRQIGLWDDSTDGGRSIITGVEFAELSDTELRERVEDMKIIARARPMDKKRLVEALQGNNEVVAVTGDGTNDAPALKTAHVGLSMGDGTSVAKEASDITIIDNSFSSIGRAVMWGRSLYQNIQRFILFQLTVNVVACLIVLCGAFMGMESPLTVTQMLWVNLIMDTFAAMALASLPPSRSVMKEKPRSREAFIIDRPMWRFIIGVGGIFFILLFGILFYFEHTELTSLTEVGRLPIGANTGLSSYELSLFFTIFVFLQFWNMFNARAFATGRSAFHFKDCGGFILIVTLIFFGQIAIVSIGGNFFNVEPLRLTDWVIIIAGTSGVLWIGEGLRLISHSPIRKKVMVDGSQSHKA